VLQDPAGDGLLGGVERHVARARDTHERAVRPRGQEHGAALEHIGGVARDHGGDLRLVERGPEVAAESAEHGRAPLASARVELPPIANITMKVSRWRGSDTANVTVARREVVGRDGERGGGRRRPAAEPGRHQHDHEREHHRGVGGCQARAGEVRPERGDGDEGRRRHVVL
jgi:hypothetical protein